MYARHTQGTDPPGAAPDGAQSRWREAVAVPEDCAPLRETLTLVGDKWSVLVITLLGGGTLRFMELLRAVEGISQRMLTLTLRRLERDGLVQRTVYPTVPPRVEYDLTPLGRTLLEPVQALADWAAAHRSDIDAARRNFDARSGAGDGPQGSPGESAALGRAAATPAP